jgi:hypothetical protein
MRFAFGFAAAALLILFCSCDKHHLGELPEVQKEHVDLAGKSENAPERASSAEAPAAKSTSPSESENAPTPAEFFSPTKSP